MTTREEVVADQSPAELDDTSEVFVGASGVPGVVVAAHVPSLVWWGDFPSRPDLGQLGGAELERTHDVDQGSGTGQLLDRL